METTALPPHLRHDPVVARLQRRAQQARARYPGIECVVLFGSRARGDHRSAHSDYDVTLIARAGHAPSLDEQAEWRQAMHDAADTGLTP